MPVDLFGNDIDRTVYKVYRPECCHCGAEASYTMATGLAEVAKVPWCCEYAEWLWRTFAPSLQHTVEANG